MTALNGTAMLLLLRSSPWSTCQKESGCRQALLVNVAAPATTVCTSFQMCCSLSLSRRVAFGSTVQTYFLKSGLSVEKHRDTGNLLSLI